MLFTKSALLEKEILLKLAVPLFQRYEWDNTNLWSLIAQSCWKFLNSSCDMLTQKCKEYSYTAKYLAVNYHGLLLQLCTSLYRVKGIDIPGRFLHFLQVRLLCDFLFAFLGIKPLQRRILLYKERSSSSGADSLHLELTPVDKGGKNILIKLPPLQLCHISESCNQNTV